MIIVYAVLLVLFLASSANPQSFSQGAPDQAGYTYGFGKGWLMPEVNKFLYFFGNSHDPFGDNSVRLYDPVADAWTPLTGKDPHNGNPQNRDNFASLYVPQRHELWMWGGSLNAPVWDNLTPLYCSGVFNTISNTWTSKSTTCNGAFAGIIKNHPGAIGNDPACAWNEMLNIGICFGGSEAGNAGQTQYMFRLNQSGGPEPYEVINYTGSDRPPGRCEISNSMVAAGLGFYFFGGLTGCGGSEAGQKDFYYFDPRAASGVGQWTRLADGPSTAATGLNCVTYDFRFGQIAVFGGSQTATQPNTAVRQLAIYTIATNTWQDRSSDVVSLTVDGINKNRQNQTCFFEPTTGRNFYLGGVANAENGSDLSQGEIAFWSKTPLIYNPGGPSVSLANNTWMPFDAPTETNGPCPKFSGCKHVNWAEDTVNGKMYAAGGDYVPTAGGAAGSYVNDVWSLDLSTLPYAWVHEYPYFGKSGDQIPCRPDESNVTFDSKRNKIWVLPGTYVPDPGEIDSTYSTGAICKFAPEGFNPTTQHYDFPGTYHAAQGNSEQPRFAHYDPVCDCIIGFGTGTSSSSKATVYRYFPATDTWTQSSKTTATGGEPIGGFSFYSEGSAIDPVGRRIFSADPYTGTVVRYDIDADTFTVVSTLPALPGDAGNWHDPAQHRQDFARYAWDSINRVFVYMRNPGGSMTGQANDEVHYSRPQEQPVVGHDGWPSFYLYDPRLNTWTQAPNSLPTLCSDCMTIRIRANQIQFSSRYNVLLAMGWEPTQAVDGLSPQTIPESQNNKHYLFRFQGATATATLATLQVNSTNPQSGVTIAVTDPTGTTNVNTPFNQSYSTGITVTLVAPATAGGSNFQSWTGCDTVGGTGNRTCSVAMSFNKGVTANFSAPTNTLSITSSPITQVSMTYSPSPDFLGNASPCLTQCTLKFDPSATSWTFCANENATCTFTGTKIIRYGAGTGFNTQTATGSIACNNATFGDPAPGVVKHCDTTDTVSTVSVTASAVTGYSFTKWQLDGSDFALTPTVSVQMATNHTLSAVYTQTITGPVFPAAPGNPVATCDPDGSSATLSWDAVGNSTSYSIRLDYIPNNTSPGCIDNWFCTQPPDLVLDQYTGGLSYLASIIPNSDYRFWVHSMSGSTFGSAANSATFNCGAPITSMKLGNVTIKFGAGTSKVGLQ